MTDRKYPFLVSALTDSIEPRKPNPKIKMDLGDVSDNPGPHANPGCKCLIKSKSHYPSKLMAIMAVLDESDLPYLRDIFAPNGTLDQGWKVMLTAAQRGLSAVLPLRYTRDVASVYSMASKICNKINTCIEEKFGRSPPVFIDVEEILFLTHAGAEKFFEENPGLLDKIATLSSRNAHITSLIDTDELDTLGQSNYENVEV